MESISTIFRIGTGPSSSHTMAPKNALEFLIELQTEKIVRIEAELYGSLALTGKGHLTDNIIEAVFTEYKLEGEVKFVYSKKDLLHPNQLKYTFFFEDKQQISYDVLSIGGGKYQIVNFEELDPVNDCYPHSKFSEIVKYCQQNNLTLVDYVNKFEPHIENHLYNVWNAMKDSVKAGLFAKGKLPGKLEVDRVANKIIRSKIRDRELVLSSYAYAVSEENASGKTIVTAPTCGACGVLPAVLNYYYFDLHFTSPEIVNALKIAGLIGTLIRHNASISGAEAGCQAEVGSATSMAAAASLYLTLPNADFRSIEAAAEIGLEHSLGLTCDPVLGYVQIPCIQRNAVGAVKAYSAALLAGAISDSQIVCFDTIVKVMLETGTDMQAEYRETAIGGLAKAYRENTALEN